MKVACLSDSHGNIYALEKALRLIGQFSPDMVIYMGDAVDYIPGMQCVRKLIDLNIPCLMGNHEDMLLSRNLYESRDDVYKQSATLATATAQELDAIRGWQHHMIIGSCAFYHGGPNRPLYEYIYPDSDLDIPLAKLGSDIRICVGGHTHRPFVKQHKDVLFVNVGSCGMPRDDGHFGAFGIIDTDKVVAQIYRFDLTHELAQSIDEFGPVHPSVVELSNRTSPDGITGEIIG